MAGAPDPMAVEAAPPESPPSSAEPPLYFYKLFVVLMVLAALATILAAPFTTTGEALWFLAAFAATNVLNGAFQASRMVGALLQVRRRAAPQPEAAAAKRAAAAGGKGAAAPPPIALIKDADCAGAVAAAADDACGDSDAGLRSDGASSTDGVVMLTLDDAPAWRHVFVIPNYKEDLAVLTATLDRLASHPHATHYTILLAMEAKEPDAAAKASGLADRYAARFAEVLHTLHTLDPATEMPGKASNVNAAVRQFAAMVPAAERPRYLLTIMDADALVPPAYVAQIEAASASRGGAGSAAAARDVYAAPVLFEQNGCAVPALVRVTDYMWAALAMQNLNSIHGVGFPISNYSLPLSLAVEMGFWDTWPDAIGEDMHTFVKAYANTHGSATLVPIFAPVNMAHIDAGSFLGTCAARYTQAERHMRGIADTAYAMRAAARGSVPLNLRSAALVWGCWEAHLVSMVALAAYLFLPLFYGALGTFKVPGVIDHPLERAVIDNLGRANLALIVVVLVCYEYVRAASRRRLYGMAEPSIPRNPIRAVLHVVSYLWLFVGV